MKVIARKLLGLVLSCFFRPLEERKMSTPISISDGENKNFHQESRIDLDRNTEFKQTPQMSACFEPESGLSKDKHQRFNKKTDAVSRFSTEGIVFNSVSPLPDDVIPEKNTIQMDFAMTDATNADESRGWLSEISDVTIYLSKLPEIFLSRALMGKGIQ